MRIAIPKHGSRVSPRIDCTGTFLVADTADGSLEDVYEVSCSGPGLRCMFEMLLRENIDTVVCGGIRREDRFILADAGIDVYSGWIGELKNVLNCFVAGQRGRRREKAENVGRGNI